MNMLGDKMGDYPIIDDAKFKDYAVFKNAHLNQGQKSNLVV